MSDHTYITVHVERGIEFGIQRNTYKATGPDGRTFWTQSRSSMWDAIKRHYRYRATGTICDECDARMNAGGGATTFCSAAA